eukprot:9486951-Pyramimonas_sp.AAC.1
MQMWNVSGLHVTRAHHAGSQVVVQVHVELMVVVTVLAVTVLAVAVAHVHGQSWAACIKPQF